MLFRSGARDVEGEEGPETVVGAAGPHELLAQRQRTVSILSPSSSSASSLFRSGGLRLVVVGVGEGGTGFLSARRLTHREKEGQEGILGFARICGRGDRIGGGETETETETTRQERRRDGNHETRTRSIADQGGRYFLSE